MKIDKSKLFKTAWEIAREASQKFNKAAKSFFCESLKQAWKTMTSVIDTKQFKNAVKIGDIYNIGIGYGESADCTIIEIRDDFTNGDTAHLRMNDCAGPIQKLPVSYLLNH